MLSLTVNIRKLIIWSLSAVLLLALAILILSRRESGIPANSITARYIGESGESQPPQTGLVTLRVTNNTQKSLNIELAGIEVLLGNVWTNHPSDAGGWPNSPRFPVGKGIYSTILPPRAAAYGRMRRFGVPETSPWRLKLSISEELHGPRYVIAGISDFLSELVHHRRLENPFPAGKDYMGQPRETVSEAVYVERVIKRATP